MSHLGTSTPRSRPNSQLHVKPVLLRFAKPYDIPHSLFRKEVRLQCAIHPWLEFPESNLVHALGVGGMVLLSTRLLRASLNHGHSWACVCERGQILLSSCDKAWAVAPKARLAGYTCFGRITCSPSPSLVGICVILSGNLQMISKWLKLDSIQNQIKALNFGFRIFDGCVCACTCEVRYLCRWWVTAGMTGLGSAFAAAAGFFFWPPGRGFRTAFSC